MIASGGATHSFLGWRWGQAKLVQWELYRGLSKCYLTHTLTIYPLSGGEAVGGATYSFWGDWPP